ncbi:MAG: cytochrome c [Pseudomonadota bacterium]|nr:cytochrome c [Pseudomonadota bacterium]
MGLWSAAAAGAEQEILQRGEYLLHAGGCISCHTDGDAGEDGFLAGGLALETAFGTFYAPNITPDPDTGISTWSDADFIRALTQGLSPDGRHYYPAFPYTAYAGMTRDDLLALKAYLFSLKPARRDRRPHDLPWYVSSRLPLGLWKWLNFQPGEFRPDPQQSAGWNRGAYLVRHLGHCGECHTPRTWTGGLDRERALAGNPDGPEGDAVPNITPDPDTGIGDWSAYDIEYLLETGTLPDGDFVGGTMSRVVDDGTSHLTDDDRKAIGVYLKALPPLPSAAR